MNVQPTGIVELNHAAHYLTASDPPKVYVAASRDAQISVIGEDLKIHRHRRQRARISALTIDPAGKWIAVAFFRPERLVIERADSGLVFRDTTAQRFEECRFDTGGNCLWATVRIASDQIECQLLDIPSLQVVARSSINDDFGDSGCALCHGPSRDSIILWMADGQGASRTLLLSGRGEEISCETGPLLTDAYPPVFNDSGTEFLAADGNRLRRFSYPALQLVGSCTFPGEDGFERSCFVDRETALIRTTSGRLFLVDTGYMRLADEAVIVQPETPPTTPDRRPGMEILNFERFGDKVVLVCQREGTVTGTLLKDTLLLCDLAQFRRCLTVNSKVE